MRQADALLATALSLSACTSAGAAGPNESESIVFDDDTSALIGKPAPEWHLEKWINSAPLSLASLRGSVVLIRWFAAPSCPYCTATAASLKKLDQTHRDRGLRVIGAYHHKQDTPLVDAKVTEYVREFGYTFPVAIDPSWRTINEWWLTGHENRKFTSAAFLIDRLGIIREVHLGGSILLGAPDYVALEKKIVALLAEK